MGVLTGTVALLAMDAGVAIGVAVFAGFVFCIVVHECAHALVAYWCGDDTARLLGRLTLNPLPHIDPFMSVLLPALLWFSGSSVLFGGAKPVPVNPLNLRHPIRDMMWVALAGPVSNVLLAFGFAAFLNFSPWFYGHGLAFGTYYPIILANLVRINIVLALFNLIPIPPLDGSRVLAVVMPTRWAVQWYRYEVQAIGMALVMLLVLGGGLGFLGTLTAKFSTFVVTVTDVSGWQMKLIQAQGLARTL